MYKVFSLQSKSSFFNIHYIKQAFLYQTRTLLLRSKQEIKTVQNVPSNITECLCDFFHGHVYRNQWSWVQNKSPRMASLRIFPETVLVYTFTLLQVVEHKTLFDWIQGLIAVSNYRYTEKANDNKLVLNPPRVGEEWIVNPWLARMLKVQHHQQCTCF